MDIQGRVESVIQKVHMLAKKCYSDFEFTISFLTLFSHSEEEFSNLQATMQSIGEESQANNGYKYQLRTPFEMPNENISLVRIRRPDIHRKEIGCVDFSYKEKDYPKLRAIALEKGYDIIIRKGYEMIELSDMKINAYA